MYQFSMSYFDHTQLVKRNMLLEILKNPEDLSIEVGFLLSLQQTPVLAVTEPKGDPETTSSTGDKRVCLTTIQKMSHFQK